MPNSGRPVDLSDLDNAPASLHERTSDRSDEAVKLRKLLQEFSAISDEKGRLEIELDELKRANRGAEILNDLIEPFANKTFWFMCCYCGFVGVVLVANGTGRFETPISDPVLRILVGSTAATVIGLVGMVLTGIFVGARRRNF